MIINHKAVLSAGFRAFAVFLALDFVLEYLTQSLFGISVKSLFGNASFGARFTVTYFLLTGLGWLLIMYVYVILRSRFASRRNAALATCGIFFTYTVLLLTQLLNFGLVSLKLYVIFAAFNTIEMPMAMLVGVLSFQER